MIEIEFIGAARTVTGSKHLIRTSRAAILLDCGLFQGHRKEAAEKNKHIGVEPNEIDAVVLSHAHIDHSGALPAFYKKGFRGSIYATPATRDLCSPMLLDTAWIMKADAEHIARMISKGFQNIEPVEPLYAEGDVLEVMERFIGLPYHSKHTIAPGIELTFMDAGHILGSALTILDITDEGVSLRVAFTGDLGRKHLPLIRSPEVPSGVNCLITESTYGDRLHEPIANMGAHLAEVIQRTINRGGKVIVPSFAMERAQEIIYELKNLRSSNQIPKVPVHVDSPLIIKLTDIFKLHAECLEENTYFMLRGENSIFDFDGLNYVSSVEESKRVSLSKEPCIVISASGMCEGGRVLHHLQTTIEDKKNTILIVGYQAEHTLGRKIVERLPEVRIFGKMHRLEAEVAVLNGFSAHADQIGIINFADSVRKIGSLDKVILIHGEPKPQAALQELLNKNGFKDVSIPGPGDRIRI